MKRLYYFAYSILLLFFLGSCDIEEDSNFSFVPLQTVAVEAPEAFIFNETHEITVTYLRPNDCTFFLGFDVINDGETTRNIVATGQMLSDSSGCNQQVEEVETTFNLVVLFSGTYLLRFWTGEDQNGVQQYIEIEIPVTQ